LISSFPGPGGVVCPSRLWSDGGFHSIFGKGAKFSKEEKMNLKLYVGNLPFGVSEDDLRKLFSEAGEIQSVKLVTDSYSGQSRGFGFVEMASQEGAEKAISLLNGKSFMNRTLTVNEARPQKKRGGDFRGRRDRDR
jgi:RNA recognition motif-containing protein